MDETIPQWPLYVNILYGALYLAMGLLGIMQLLGIMEIPLPLGDIMTPIMLLIVGTVYLAGVPSLAHRFDHGYAYTVVATILAAILFILQVLVLLSNALGWVLGLEDWAEWNLTADFSPTLWLFLLVLFGVWILRTTNRLGGEKGMFPIGE